MAGFSQPNGERTSTPPATHTKLLGALSLVLLVSAFGRLWAGSPMSWEMASSILIPIGGLLQTLSFRQGELDQPHAWTGRAAVAVILLAGVATLADLL